MTVSLSFIMNLFIEMFLNLLINPFAWLFLYFSFVGIYSIFILYHQRNPEKHLMFFKITVNSGAFFGIIIVFAVHFTMQPRIYGSLGMFLTPTNQIITEPSIDLGVFPGLILSIIGFGFTIPGICILIITAYKVLKVISYQHFESKEILDTGFWGIVRNPIYTSLMLIYIGMALTLGAIYSLILSPIFYISHWLSGWIESALNLEKTFGIERVEAYKKKVPHMLFNKQLWIVIVVLSTYLIILTIWGYFPLY
ncbi:MAG: methyltransferase family protein [Promethearchaeota archaeon]